MLMQRGKNLTLAAAKAGMDRKTGRKYLRLKELPSQCAKDHTWQTRTNPFDQVWEEVEEVLDRTMGMEGKFLFEMLQRKYPGRFCEGQLRTFQRKIKVWRATAGPPKEVFFSQEYQPGQLCESDFTCLNKLNITIGGQLFPHLLYHFVLPYSNWETGTICFSESFESLSTGLQNALWELGGIPRAHRTDRLSSAVHKECNPEEFTDRYQGVLRHYGMTGEKIQAGKANENGDVEQRHYRFVRAMEQTLQFRGSRDFESWREYEIFVVKLFRQVNAGRESRLAEELKILQVLPQQRLDDCRRITVRVGQGSTIRVLHNTYSVDSRLIGELVEIRVYVQHIELWYGQKKADTIPRLRGENGHAINYRHIIDSLVRKPGAFEQYRYREDLFPSTIFRMAYDALRAQNPATASRVYLEILNMAGKENEDRVAVTLEHVMEKEQPISADSVKEMLKGNPAVKMTEVLVEAANLAAYDEILGVGGLV